MRKAVQAALSSVEASLCRSEAEEKEKLRERVAVWEGEGSRLLPLPIVPRAPPIFPLLLFLLGYPAGASGEERALREKGNKQHGRGPELVPLTDPCKQKDHPLLVMLIMG